MTFFGTVSQQTLKCTGKILTTVTAAIDTCERNLCHLTLRLQTVITSIRSRQSPACSVSVNLSGCYLILKIQTIPVYKAELANFTEQKSLCRESNLTQIMDT